MRALLVGLALSLATPAFGVEPGERLDDPELEARARALSAELRCLICRNESIDESNAELARDLRLLVRERLTEGDTDAEVIDFIVDRYGEYVLLRPAATGSTLILWLAPAAMLAAAGAIAFVSLRRPRPGPQALSEAEDARLKELVGDDRSDA